MIINPSVFNSMKKMDWKIIHLFGRFYLCKKYNNATKGIRGLIWTVDYVKRREDKK